MPIKMIEKYDYEVMEREIISMLEFANGIVDDYYGFPEKINSDHEQKLNETEIQFKLITYRQLLEVLFPIAVETSKNQTEEK